MKCLLLCLLFAGLLTAQQPEPKTPELPALKPLHVPARIGISGVLELSLDDVIRRVMENDRDLEVTRLSAQEAVLGVKSAKGYFDPLLGLTAYRLRSVTPVASLIGGTASGKLTQKELYADPQISGSLPYFGSTYQLDFSSARQSTDSTFVTLNPQFPSAANLNFTQPLWRGFRFDENRHRLLVARKNVSLTNEQLRQRVITSVTQAIQAYWELDFAYRSLNVQVEAVRLAEQQDMSNRRQVQQGILAPVDVIQTQTQIATFQQNVYTAQQSLTNAENTLKQIIVADRQDPVWSSALVPTTPVDAQIQLPELTQAVTQAIAERPEIAESKTNIDVNQLDTRLNQEQARPQINAVARLSSQGLAGYPVPVVANPILAQFGLTPGAVPALLVGGYNQSLNNIYNGAFPTVQVGVQMSLPIRNRSASALLASALLEGKRLKAQQQQVEMAVEADVRNSLQTASAARLRLEAAQSASHFADDQYQSERRQFQAGTSSVFLVLQRQTDLIAARSREIRAQADLGNAAADLDRALARTLRIRNIDVSH